LNYPKSTYGFKLDFEGAGFFGIPHFADDFRLPDRPGPDPWLFCAYALDRAKRGDFAHIPTLLNLYGTTDNLDIDSLCTGFLAVAGPASCFSRIVEIVKQESNIRKALPFCGAMSARGELSYVPILLEKYLVDETNDDAQLLPIYIRDAIGDIPYSAETDVYEDVILDQYQRMIDRFGSDKVLVFRGELYSVPLLARSILDKVAEPTYFHMQWRIDFEAATGIDCSSWYQDGRVRPLAVAAIVEEFLESPNAAQYEEGIRYFFGHRIPD
jgi:hypothetical protein